MKTPKQILKAKKCGDLFENDLDLIKSEYRELAKTYHPDLYHEENASEIFAIINTLYTKALDLYEHGLWEQSNSIFIKPKGGKTTFKFNYLSEKIFELGKFYISGKHVVYLLDSQHKKYYENALKRIKSIRYSDSNMESQFSRCMPNIKDSYETEDGKWCIILNKTEDVFLLEDLLKQQGGKLDDLHVAWVISRLSNLVCFLRFNQIVHNGISLKNCFVSPSYHSILILGGWWYSTGENQEMIGTQKEIYDIMPLNVKQSKRSDSLTDLESVKLIGKQLLDDMTFLPKKGSFDFTPEPFKDWLKKAPSMNPVEEFKLWNKALDKAYGPRKFIELKVSEEDIYGKI